MQQIDQQSGKRTTFLLVGLIACFAFAFGIRVAHYENEPITDELYHLLAADSWTQDGSFAIADGEYKRARIFTVMVATVHRVSSGDVNNIRLLCITIGAILVAVVFGWTAQNTSRGAALTAAFLLAINPGAIFLSQYIRFYSLHALVFFLLAWCCWAMSKEVSYRRRWLLASCIVLLTFLGIHLQVTTLVGLAGIGIWLLIVKWRVILDSVPGSRQRLLIAAIIAFSILAVAYFTRSTIMSLLETYRESALWNSGDNALYYYNLYRRDLGVLWSLAPAAAILALLSRPAQAFFCVTIFATAFAIQSFGGMRSERFMFYAIPWFFIIWGIAAAAVATGLRSMLEKRLLDSKTVLRNNALRKLIPAASILTIAAIAGFALLTMPAFETFARMTAGRPTSPPDYWDRYRTNWDKVAEFLLQAHADAAVTVASQPLHAIYYLGNVDYTLNATTLGDIAAPGVHSKIDSRTGRLVFDDVTTMKSIVACQPSGIVIIHEPAWRNPTRVNNDVSDFLELQLERVPLPVKSDLMLFRWTSPMGASHNCSS